MIGLRGPRFVVDSMLGKLSRWLRILGYDTMYVGNSSDEHILNIARAEERVILTCDVQLFRRATKQSLEVFLVSMGDDHSVRVAKLARRFKLSLEAPGDDCRCPKCNSPLQQANRESVKDRVPPSSLHKYNIFWSCTNPACAKAYWQGTHWRNISTQLNQARMYLSTHKE